MTTTPASTAAIDAHQEPARSLALLQQRYNAQALTPSIDIDRVRQLIATIDGQGRWPDINYEDLSTTGFEHRWHLANMAWLARAYVHVDSPLRADADLRRALFLALDHWLEQDFICQNWWWNEIGVPRQLVVTLLLLNDELSNEQRERGVAIVSRANFEGRGARPGGDLVQIAEIMVQRGLLAGDADVIEQAVAAMVSELRITTGRGIQPDQSFHHRPDGVNQTLAYGRAFMRAVAAYAGKSQGTIFALPQDRIALLIDYMLDGIRWTLAHGSYPNPGGMNRELSRRSAVRAWDATVPRDLLAASDHRADELRNLLAVRTGAERPAWSGNRFFWRAEFLAHQRPGYHATVRMYSERNQNTERTFTDEGLRAHYLADGSHFIIRTGEEYLDVFPAWDWQKVPGTTVLQKSALPSSRHVHKRGLTRFVGGLSDGTFGHAAMDFQSPHDPLAARKAWFFFDDEFVALGAGIKADAAGVVATTLNQCRLIGAVVVGAAEDQTELNTGEHTLDNAAWVHHDGIAYVFPAAASVNLDNTTVAGDWSRIGHGSWARGQTVEVPMFKLWLNHGERPADASYAYIVVPGIDVEAAAQYGRSLPIRILANTPQLQAVRHTALGVSQIVFYTAGEVAIAEGVTVAADEPCLVMVTMAGEAVTQVTVADPTQTMRRLGLRISTELAGERAAWDAAAGQTMLTFDLPRQGHAGQSVTRTFVVE